MFKEYFEDKKLITFDLDGTTIKSEAIWDLAFREVAKISGIDPQTTGIAGDTVTKRWEQIIREQKPTAVRPIQELSQLTFDEFLKHLDSLTLTEGFWPFVGKLKLLRKISLTLVTGTPRIIAEKVIDRLELNKVYDYIICGDEVKNSKPDPEIYKKTLDHFKLSGRQVLAFEDSLTGCIAAAKAGIKVICVWDGLTPQRKYPDEVIGFTTDFTPFPGEMDTTYLEDLEQIAKEREEAGELS